MGTLPFYTTKMLKFQTGDTLRIAKDRQEDYTAMHGHDYTELVFVASGSAIHTHEDRAGRRRVTPLIPGDILAVSQGERHGYHNAHNLVLYNIYWISDESELFQTITQFPGWKYLFDASHLEESTSVLHLSPTERIQAEAALNRAVSECKTQSLGWSLLTQALFSEFMVISLRSFTLRKPVEENSQGLFAAVAKMERDMTLPLTLHQLAAVSYMGLSSFTQKFKQTFGCSALEYLHKIRLKEAEFLLLTTDKPLWEIARKVGFNSTNYLIRLFKREYQVTPLQFRHRINETKEMP